jgi:hypothetical protein
LRSIDALRARIDQREELLVAASSAARASTEQAEHELHAAIRELHAREARALGDADAYSERCKEVIPGASVFRSSRRPL